MKDLGEGTAIGSGSLFNDHFTIQHWGDEAHGGTGWYHFDTDYPEEGSVGPFTTATEAFFDAVEPLSQEERKAVSNTLVAAREADRRAIVGKGGQ